MPAPVLVRLTPRAGASAQTRDALGRLGPVCSVESVIDPGGAWRVPVVHVSALPGPGEALPMGWCLFALAEVDVALVDDPALAESARRPALDVLRARIPPPTADEIRAFLARHGRAEGVAGGSQPGGAAPFTPPEGHEPR